MICKKFEGLLYLVSYFLDLLNIWVFDDLLFIYVGVDFVGFVYI